MKLPTTAAKILINYTITDLLGEKHINQCVSF